MNTIYDSFNDEVPLSDLCYLIYQGFGASGVVRFIQAMEYDIPNIKWVRCVPCGDVEYPHEHDEDSTTCLVCDTDNKQNLLQDLD